MIRLLSSCVAATVICAAAQAAHSGNTTPYEQRAHKTFQNTLRRPVRDGKADQIVVYSASWCTPCQRLKPILLSLKEEGYKVVHRDVDKDGDKLKYSYSSVPTIYFVRGEVVIKTEMGYRSKEHIKKTLAQTAESNPLKSAIEWQ